MEIKTSLHLNIDLRLDSDSAQPTNDLALRQLAAICDGLHLLLRAQSISQETLPEDGDIDPVLPAITAVDSTPPTAQTEELAEEVAVEPPPSRRQMPASRSWSFEQFDGLVRAEMQRLTNDGKMPTTALWDRERSPDLPTLVGVIRRYGCKNIADLAHTLGYAPAGVRPGPAPSSVSMSSNGREGHERGHL